jgi:hypothetical protein
MSLTDSISDLVRRTEMSVTRREPKLCPAGSIRVGQRVACRLGRLPVMVAGEALWRLLAVGVLLLQWSSKSSHTKFGISSPQKLTTKSS